MGMDHLTSRRRLPEVLPHRYKAPVGVGEEA